MIVSYTPHQADPKEYAYVSGSFAVRRGLLLPVQELQSVPRTIEALVTLLNRGVYAPMGAILTAQDALMHVEDVWRRFLERTARDLPEPFLPYVLKILDERDYAKAGLAGFLLYGDKCPAKMTGLAAEYGEYCSRLEKAGEKASLLFKETFFGRSLADGLRSSQRDASASDAQMMFDLSVSEELHRLAVAYGHPSVIAYSDGLLDLVLAGYVLKLKLRSSSGVAVSAERSFAFADLGARAKLTALAEHVQPIAWDMLQPRDLVGPAVVADLPTDRRYTKGQRLRMLEDSLETWLVDYTRSSDAEPYGVTMVFAYMIDFRREVWTLRRLLRSAVLIESAQRGAR